MRSLNYLQNKNKKIWGITVMRKEIFSLRLAVRSFWKLKTLSSILAFLNFYVEFYNNEKSITSWSGFVSNSSSLEKKLKLKLLQIQNK